MSTLEESRRLGLEFLVVDERSGVVVVLSARCRGSFSTNEDMSDHEIMLVESLEIVLETNQDCYEQIQCAVLEMICL